MSEAKKNQGGRTKKELEDKLSERFAVYVNKKDAKWILKHAKYYQSTSDFIYRCLKETEITLPDNSTVLLLKEMAELKQLMKEFLEEKKDDSRVEVLDKVNKLISDIETINQTKIKKELVLEFKKIGTNVNQIAKKVNSFKDNVDVLRILYELEEVKNMVELYKKIISNYEHNSNKV
jgi:hypothetical protein